MLEEADNDINSLAGFFQVLRRNEILIRARELGELLDPFDAELLAQLGVWTSTILSDEVGQLQTSVRRQFAKACHNFLVNGEISFINGDLSQTSALLVRVIWSGQGEYICFYDHDEQQIPDWKVKGVLFQHGETKVEVPATEDTEQPMIVGRVLPYDTPQAFLDYFSKLCKSIQRNKGSGVVLEASSMDTLKGSLDEGLLECRELAQLSTAQSLNKLYSTILAFLEKWSNARYGICYEDDEEEAIRLKVAGKMRIIYKQLVEEIFFHALTRFIAEWNEAFSSNQRIIAVKRLLSTSLKPTYLLVVRSTWLWWRLVGIDSLPPSEERSLTNWLPLRFLDKRADSLEEYSCP